LYLDALNDVLGSVEVQDAVGDGLSQADGTVSTVTLYEKNMLSYVIIGNETLSIMLLVIKLLGIRLSVVMLNVVMLSVIMLCVAIISGYVSVLMLSVLVLSVLVLSVLVLSVLMLSVALIFGYAECTYAE
jgi:hypothetical protein